MLLNWHYRMSTDKGLSVNLSPRILLKICTGSGAQARWALSGSLRSFLALASPNLFGKWDMEELHWHSGDRSFKNTRGNGVTFTDEW